MARLVKPVLFSSTFGVSQTTLTAAGFIDPILNSDTKLFIDPVLLRTSANQLMKSKGYPLLRSRFSDVVRLLSASRREGDAAWKAAAGMLDLQERSETCLGYGGASTRGSSRPEHVQRQILSTAKDIIELGEKDPEIISMMGLFEDGVGPDTISDLTTNFILPVLAEITEEFCRLNGVKAQTFTAFGNRTLPLNPFNGRPVLLVPSDVLRDLPLATDWADVSRVMSENQELRRAMNKLFGGITQKTVKAKKAALKSAAFGSLSTFQQIFRAILQGGEPYSPKLDMDGFYAFRKILVSNTAAYAGLITPPTSNTAAELRRVVDEIIGHFVSMVEDNNGFELLWANGKPRHERAAQLLFFAIADIVCRANNIDISPETNSGGGPVDFKFSTGYADRVLVEIKLSTGQVKAGYTKQLEVYKTAAKTKEGIFLVLDVGGMGGKLREIRRLKAEAEQRGETTSSIVVVDATRRPSASKRRA